MFEMVLSGFLFLFIKVILNLATAKFDYEIFSDLDSEARLQKINNNPKKFKMGFVLILLEHISIITLSVMLFIAFSPYNIILASPSYFCQLRKRVANKLQKPRIKAIHRHTFRHWNATMEYHETKAILHVMRRLGHKRIGNTLLYMQLVQFESDDYHSAVAENVDEAKKLIEVGFEYVCT
jgi:integrase